MKKNSWQKILIIVLVVMVGGYLFLNHTLRGRVLSLYAFGGFKAPIATKISCGGETNTRVTDKFKQPLDFDQESKDALREYWHFSYYRECLFKKGYDFSGNVVKPSVITLENEQAVYTNHFAGMNFSVPVGTIIISDNATNPDIEDRRLSSVLEYDGKAFSVLVYRSFDDVDSFNALQNDFQKFATSTGLMISKEVEVNKKGVNMLRVQQDDGLSGFVTFSYKDQVIQIFGEDMPVEMMSRIEETITFVE